MSTEEICQGCESIKLKAKREGVTGFKLYSFLFRPKAICKDCQKNYFFSTGKASSLLYAIPMGIVLFLSYFPESLGKRFFYSVEVNFVILFVVVSFFIFQIRKPFCITLDENAKTEKMYRVLGFLLSVNICLLYVIDSFKNLFTKNLSNF